MDMERGGKADREKKYMDEKEGGGHAWAKREKMRRMKKDDGDIEDERKNEIEEKRKQIGSVCVVRVRIRKRKESKGNLDKEREREHVRGVRGREEWIVKRNGRIEGKCTRDEERGWKKLPDVLLTAKI